MFCAIKLFCFYIYLAIKVCQERYLFITVDRRASRIWKYQNRVVLILYDLESGKNMFSVPNQNKYHCFPHYSFQRQTRQMFVGRHFMSQTSWHVLKTGIVGAQVVQFY